ncbi:MAG: TonB-dependent receptor [Porticoccaceae bacterium]|nr:TonB-dependent receptor [Porticoccaceae bacterium]
MTRKLAILLSLAVALPVVGAEPADKRLDEVIITATRVAESPASLIGNSAALDSDALTLTAHTHIQEALAQLPGVGMHRNNGQEYLPAIRSPVLSGGGACGSFLIAEDGIPLRPAGFCNVNELFEAHSEAASRIEVIRGPGNALYGSNALHGVINVIGPATFNSGWQLGLEGGANDYGRVRLSAGGENLAFAFTGSSDGGYRDDSGVDQQKLSLRHRYQGDSLRVTSGLTAVNLNQETAGFAEGYRAYRDRRLSRANPNPEAYRDAQAVRVWSRIEPLGGASDGQPGWVITPYARWSDMAFLQHFLPGQPLEENGQRSIGVQSALYRYGDNQRLIAGVDMELTRGWLRQAQDSPTQGSAMLQETIPMGRHYDYRVNAAQLAPFVQWDWQFAPRWKLAAGLRYEHMRYDYDNRMVDGRTREDGTVCGFGGCRYSRPADSKDHFDNVSPKLGLLYDISDSQQLFATLARGFRAPQAVEMYRLERAQQKANLDSEQLDSLELGVRGHTGALRYEVVAYAMEKDNVIFRDTDFFNVSDGKTDHLGVEFSLNYRFSEAFDLNVAGTYARHRYDYSEILSGVDIRGNDVDTAPRYFVTSQLGWNPLEGTRLMLEWLRMGSYYTDPENHNRYAGHDLFHLRGRWEVSPQLTLSARVFNLFDTRYAERADYTSFGGDRYFPGEPRHLVVGLDWRW